LDVEELILDPKKTLTNVWVGQKGVVTHLHCKLIRQLAIVTLDFDDFSCSFQMTHTTISMSSYMVGSGFCYFPQTNVCFWGSILFFTALMLKAIPTWRIQISADSLYSEMHLPLRFVQ